MIEVGLGDDNSEKEICQQEWIDRPTLEVEGCIIVII